MTETENKYFAVSVDQWDKISFHKTEEDAKKECLKGAEELLDYAIEIDDISVYECQIHNAVYGVVLGKAESKTRDLNEEEKQSSWYDDIDYIVEHPKIVEYPQNNGWISVKDRLPEEREDILIYTNKGEIKLAYRYDSFFMSLLSHHISTITYWRPLPQPPKTE
ncbi:DUF551 domain-containing protein [Pasteurella multocida]|uniref:DUF551 domain-containing protein n=1 Tax=Pasteurella multocida TaxID=747 RepID=UPI00397CFCD8